MAKNSKNDKTKPNVDKMVKKVNKEFEKTSTQIERLIDDAFKQFDSLQSQIQEPVRKLMREIDDLREREMKRFNAELERRLGEFQDIQNSVLDRLGIAHKEATKEAEEVKKSVSKKAAQARDAAGKAASDTGKAAAEVKTGARKARTTAKAAAKGNDLSDLTRIKGIGPVTAKKLKAAGITSINQIANPSEADQEILKQFSSTRGFSNWTSLAKKLTE